MSKIRKLYYFDKKNTEEMISFLNNSVYDTYINRIMFNPLIPLHHLLPLKLKFLPESYILKDKKEIKGLITVAPTKCSIPKIEIQKLLFEEGALQDAAELVQFVVSKYKAKGVASILVKVDDYMPELLSIFVTKCNFSQISYEKLWKVNKFLDCKYDRKDFRQFRNSDSQTVANLYNEALLPHFRPLLSKEAKEFRESLFKGLSYYSEYKYVIEDKSSKNLTGLVTIRTPNNENFVVDITQTGWVDIDINSVLAFATDEIKKRKTRFALFVRTKRYTNTGEKFEQEFIKNSFECVQNQIVLTNSSARVLKDTAKSGKYTVMGDFYSSRIMPTS